VGIESFSSLPIDVDPVAPWISLNPPNVRERRLRGTNDECSGAFDPLGENTPSGRLGMVDDLDVVGPAFRPMALLWDRPLVIQNAISTTAMIDPETAKFYVQHNLDVPLLVDSDNDPNHECDAVKDGTAPMGKAPTVMVLQGILSTGTAPVPLDMTSPPDVSGEACKPTSGNVLPLADDTVLTRIIDHTAQGGSPVVWAFKPALPGQLRSTGFDYQSDQGGWACLTAAAKDYAGNYAFAPPQRICFNIKGADCNTAPPTCTDGCVIPAQFQAGAPGAMPPLLYYSR
jgi:hypothetical protein